MNNKQELIEILSVLKTIKDNIDKRLYPATGLCNEFQRVYGTKLYTCMIKYRIIFAKWEYYSGKYNFPVPDPARKQNAEREHDAEAIYWNTPDRYIGEYGKLRMQLLDWLIEQFEAKLNVK